MSLTLTSGTDDGDRTPSPRQPTAEPLAATYTRTVHHNGHRYFATAEMAAIFRAQAERTVDLGETELVPLLHSEGVELLLVSPQIRFAVVTIEVGRHKAR